MRRGQAPDCAAVDPVALQRALTVDFITKRRLNAPAVWLKPESQHPSAEDAVKGPDGLNTDLGDWPGDRNLGVRLVDGFLELGVKAPDDVWSCHLFRALDHCRVDARASYGGVRVSSILLRIEDPASIEKWTELWPKGAKDKNGNWVETRFSTSSLPTPKSKPIWRESSPLPGSSLEGSLIVWRPNGKPAAQTIESGLEDLEPRAIASTNMGAIVRAIAFATLAYWIESYLDGLEEWDASLTHVLGGWIARLAMEGAAINEKGKSLEGVCWCPVDSEDTAATLIEFLGQPGLLLPVFRRAVAELERNQLAPVPGWGAIETLFGVAGKASIRRCFRAGMDITAIERMSEQYIFDSSTHSYVDREALLKGLPYEHKHDDLARQYENETIFIGGKPKNPFRMYSASSLRSDVQRREFFPGRDAGSLLRFSRVHGILDKEERRPDDYSVLNTFSGFAIKPIATIDQALMGTAITMVDRMLGLLTQDNDEQIKWLKKFIAQIAQSPEIKPQVCPIIVGGQGIGKSVFGEDLMTALFGDMAGSGDAASLADNKFLITPFIGKLITFIDEVKLESVGAINTIKKLVRADMVSGQLKFGHQRDYYIPSRLLIASNSPDIGLSPADAADRAFFFIVAYTAENRRLTDREFQEWALTLKPFYSDFTKALRQVPFRQHLMRYFVDFPVERHELENLEHSSRNDASVVRSTMSKAREVARQIATEAHVIWDRDITAWFNTSLLRGAIRRVDGPRTRIEAAQIVLEWERDNVIEHMSAGNMRFKYNYGTLLQKLGEAHNLPLHPMWPTGPGDYGDNEVASSEGGVPWRGQKFQKKERPFDGRDYEPDHMDNF